MKNNILKKVFSLAFAVTLAATLAVPAFAHGETNTEYTGAEPAHPGFGHHWAAATLTKWSEFALTPLPHDFTPDAQATAADFAALLEVVTNKEIAYEHGALTRGGAVKLIAAVLGVSEEHAQGLFIKGYGDGKPHLEDLLTYAQAVTIADRVGTHVSGEETAPIIELTGWIIDRDCLGVDAIKHTKGCNLMGGCLASGLGIFNYDPNSETPTASSLSNYYVFDGAGKAKAEAFLNSLPEDWKNNITVKVTAQLVYNIPANADETNVPETKLQAVDHYLIGIRVLTIEAAHIDGVSTNELPDGSYIKIQEIVTDYAELWSSDNITVKVGVPVKWYIYANVGSLPTVGMDCGKTIKIPGLGWGTDTYNKDEGHLTLTEGEKILVREFTPTEVGDILFTCWMGSECHGNVIHVTADGTYTSEKIKSNDGKVEISFGYKEGHNATKSFYVNGKPADLQLVTRESEGALFKGFYAKDILEFAGISQHKIESVTVTGSDGSVKDVPIEKIYNTDPNAAQIYAYEKDGEEIVRTKDLILTVTLAAVHTHDTVTLTFDYKTIHSGGRKLHVDGKATDIVPVIFEREGIKYVGFYLKSILEYAGFTKDDVEKVVLTEVNVGEPREIGVSRAFTDTDPSSGLYTAFGTVDAPSERPFKVEVTLSGD